MGIILALETIKIVRFLTSQLHHQKTKLRVIQVLPLEGRPQQTWCCDSPRWGGRGNSLKRFV